MSSSGGYQPLVAYEPSRNLAVRESIFLPSVSADHLRTSSLRVSDAIHQRPGFQFVMLMHDGRQGRALSFWRDQQALDNFVSQHQESNRAWIAAQDKDNPWITGIESRNHGEVDLHLIDASMPVVDGEVVEWSPPGAVRICEIRKLEELETLRNWWPMIASPSAPDSLAEVSGFQFFTAALYPDRSYTTYLGFQTPQHLDTYLRSELHTHHDRPFDSPEFRDALDITVHTGQLLAWFQRRIGS